MSNYTKTTDFEAKDSLPSGDSGKIIRGSEFETEFDNIATAIASKSDANNPTFTGTVTIDGLTVNGNTVLGNAASDTVTVTADIASNLLPSADDTYNLGAVGAEWNDLHVDGVAYIDTINGFAATGNVNFGDNNKAVFGAGSDLEIYHSSNQSIIKESGAGSLLLQGDNIRLQKVDGTENMITAVNDAEVSLFYNGAEKLATTLTGIDVTGKVTSDELAVEGTNGTFSVSSQGFTVGMSRPSQNIIQASNAAGSLVFQTGGSNTRLALNSNGDVSLYEDTGTTAKFFWDASTERLGIGNSAPTTALDVTGTVTADGLNASTGDITTTSIGFNGARTTTPDDLSYPIIWRSAGSHPDFNSGDLVIQARSDADRDIHFVTGNTPTERMNINGQTGDISFYEDTGTTPKFFWDSSAERLQIGSGVQTINNGANGAFSPNLAHIDDGAAQAGIVVGTGGAKNLRVGLFADDTNNVCGISTRFSSGSNPAFVFRDAVSGGNERMRIDSNGKVGIGTNSPSGDLDVSGGTSSSAFTLSGRSDSSGLVNVGNIYGRNQNAGFNGARIKMDVSNTAGNIQFQTATGGSLSEAMRLDSSGNLLVGKTIADNTTQGIRMLGSAGFASFVRDSAEPIVVNRLTNDGDLIEFRKDGAAVGSIGTHNIASSSRLYVGSGDVNLMFRPDIEVIQPASDSGLRDAAISLGNASGRFKDLYLSGGLHGDTTFKNNAGTTEYARFNSSGNLLVGKISTGTTNVGTQITGDGFTSIVGTNNNIPLYLENKGTNGNCRISFANNSHGGASLGLNNGGDFTIFDSTASTTRFNVTSSRVITASGGIAGIELGGVGVGNRLDDYEEGTFTPVVTGSTTAGTGTYSSQSGTYTKVGQVVTCSFAVNMTAHDGAGNIRISLPFSSNTNAVGMVMDQNLNYGSGASLVAFTQNQEFVQLYAVGDNLAWDVQTLADDTAFTLFVTITYRT